MVRWWGPVAEEKAFELRGLDRSENYLILQWRTLRHRRYTGLNDLLKVAYKSVAFNPNSTSKSPTEASKYAATWEPLQTC